MDSQKDKSDEDMFGEGPDVDFSQLSFVDWKSDPEENNEEEI